MLADQVLAEFLGFAQVQEAANAFVAGWIVDGNQTLPGEEKKASAPSFLCSGREAGHDYHC